MRKNDNCLNIHLNRYRKPVIDLRGRLRRPACLDFLVGGITDGKPLELEDDYAKRWSLIKARFTRCVLVGETIRQSRLAKRERGIWQRRYWEHQIRDESDLVRHVDYIHYNPVKPGWVSRAVDWLHSTLHEYIERAILPEDWGGEVQVDESRCWGEML